MAHSINLQIATFAGLGLPRTLNKPVPSDTSTSEVLQQIYNSLPNPELGPRLTISTIDGRLLTQRCTEPISSFLQDDATSLSLRLSTRLCGGKGGFGSQLRAAGGRMSSRKNKDRQNATGSNRNLDGRRLRTIDEAKKLAQYLEMKPEMDRKERQERKERWEAVIQAADETEERIKSGKMGSKQGRLDAEYLENKELAEDKIREAVARAMRQNMIPSEKTGSESSAEDLASSDSAADHDDGSSDDAAEVKDAPAIAGPSFFGWDDDYDDDDDNDHDNNENDNEEDGNGTHDKSAAQEHKADASKLNHTVDSPHDKSHSRKGKQRTV